MITTDPSPLQRLADVFRSADLDLSPDDVCDSLWLALNAVLAVDYEVSTGSASSTPSVNVATSSDTAPVGTDSPQGGPTSETSTGHGDAAVHSRPSKLSNTGDNSLRGSPFRTPAASAVPDVLGLGRALRPLMQRVPSRTKMVLDEQATVRRIADDMTAHLAAGRPASETPIVPVMRQALIRHYDVILLVDSSSSMDIWLQTVQEFARLLAHHGAFRNLRVWSFLPDDTIDQARFPGTVPQFLGVGPITATRPVHDSRELLDPSNRRIVMVVSDCIAPGWYDGRVARTLAIIGKRHPTVLFQLLPERMWSGTALGTAQAVLFEAPRAGVPNIHLVEKSAWWWMDAPWNLEGTPKVADHRLAFPIPIVTLNRDELSVWTKLLAGSGGVAAPGYLLSLVPQSESISTQESQPRPARDPLDLFAAVASPTAFRLAQLLAATAQPITLPVIRLVQQIMPEGGRQTQIAEVFLGGLLRRLTPSEVVIEPDQVEYDFHEGIRKRLQASAPVTDAADVLRRVSRYITTRIGEPFDFESLLVSPDGVGSIPLDRNTLPFARMAASLLHRTGGELAQRAARLDARIEDLLLGNGSERTFDEPLGSTNRHDINFDSGGRTILRGVAASHEQYIEPMERRAKVDLYLRFLSEAIDLTLEEKKSILAEFSNFREKVIQGYTRNRIIDTALFGSIVRGTAIRPISDIDILVLFSTETVVNPVVIFRELEVFVRSIYPDREIIGTSSQSASRPPTKPRLSSFGASLVVDSGVLINNGSVIMEILPCLARTRSIAGSERRIVVPDTHLLTWTNSNHLNHALAASKLNEQTSGNYARLVRLFKYWQRLRFPENPIVKGFVWECLVAQYINPRITSVSECFTLIMQRIFRERNSLLKFQAVPEPGRRTETKRTNLSQEQFFLLMSSIEETVKLLDTASKADTMDEELEIWFDILHQDSIVGDSEWSSRNTEVDIELEKSLKTDILHLSSFISLNSEDEIKRQMDALLQTPNEPRQTYSPSIPIVGTIYTGMITGIDASAATIDVPPFAAKKVIGLLTADVADLRKFKVGNFARVEVLEQKTLPSGQVVLMMRRAPPKTKTS